MYTEESPAAARASELKKIVFRLYDKEQAAGDGINALSDIADLMVQIFEAENQLIDHLGTHTDELIDHPAWQAYYNKFAVQLSHPMTAIACYTIADAFALAADHVADRHKAVPLDHPMLVEIHQAGGDRSIYQFLDSPDRAAEHVRRGADEYLAATTLHKVRDHVAWSKRSGREHDSRPAKVDSARLREIVDRRPAEALIARWAVAEVGTPDLAIRNPWDADMEKAGLCLGAIRHLSEIDGLLEIDREPRHPAARERTQLVDQLITHYFDHAAETRQSTASVDSEIATRVEQSTGIQHLINTAHPTGSTTATESTASQDIPESDISSPTAEPEAEL
ncbi:hypothetical protein [Nocardia sp. CDC160]|uniref:hypothetical protein n=1 Tax=Nocardia sp. CDC160 TaxID=3112166 RepID=UPI002DB7F0E3|nr:hypothetical protein [Nocardia sp. CDC160]MEC3919324.1 hypothetical protein [Nocardia sp. CDC160]